MHGDVEDMFKKITKTGYGELMIYNQSLLEKIAC